MIVIIYTKKKIKIAQKKK